MQSVFHSKGRGGANDLRCNSTVWMLRLSPKCTSSISCGLRSSPEHLIYEMSSQYCSEFVWIELYINACLYKGFPLSQWLPADITSSLGHLTCRASDGTTSLQQFTSKLQFKQHSSFLNRPKHTGCHPLMEKMSAKHTSSNKVKSTAFKSRSV